MKTYEEILEEIVNAIELKEGVNVYTFEFEGASRKEALDILKGGDDIFERHDLKSDIEEEIFDMDYPYDGSIEGMEQRSVSVDYTYAYTRCGQTLVVEVTVLYFETSEEEVVGYIDVNGKTVDEIETDIEKMIGECSFELDKRYLFEFYMSSEEYDELTRNTNIESLVKRSADISCDYFTVHHSYFGGLGDFMGIYVTIGSCNEEFFDINCKDEEEEEDEDND